MNRKSKENYPDEDYPEGGVLSAECLYPDCVGCGAVGLAHVITRAGKGNQGPFMCLECGEHFEPPYTSVWFGVFDLEEHVKRDYIAVDIRGISPKRQAQAGTSNSNEESVKRNVTRARTHINRKRNVTPIDDIAIGD